jgi:radical SAM protein with 4Fe4S-binding SPASM domain
MTDHYRFFSPWVFTTYGCTCKCPYCLVPKIGSGASMSSETFEKMLRITERIIEKGDFDGVRFRLSGGEPLLVWKNYAGLVTRCKEKNKDKIDFGILSNLTVLTDDMIEWLKKNRIGIQVSLDDLKSSKPFNDGESSSPVVLKNIERLKDAKIGFSMNTVFDYNKTKSLSDLVDYVCEQRAGQWGLSASFTLNDDTCLAETIDAIKLGILRLRDNGFDIRNNFRFYNEIINYSGKTCSAGVTIFALGTNLEVWSCQAMIDEKPLGYYDENLKELFATSKGNEYFRNRSLLPQCTDCGVLNWCRGGCRVVHLRDKKAAGITCRIKQEIINFILRETQNYNHKNGGNRNRQPADNDGFEQILKDYITGMAESDIKPVFVETPPLSEA